MSSEYHLMSNKRAELAVKATERLSMENFCLNKKLKITMARFVTQNRLPSFYLRPQIVWIKANSLKSREMVSCLVWILIINLGYLKRHFVDDEVSQKK